MFVTLLFLFDIAVGYLIGSVCTAVIICRIFDLPDPRLSGSKNPGATNVLRLAGKKYAIIVLFADMFKGLLPVLIANMLDSGSTIASFTCLAAVIGHMYPLYFGFKGGKGVATALGALLGLNFLLGVSVIATWLIVANFTRYSSLASILSITLAPFYSLYAISNVNSFVPLMFIAIFIVYKHRENITRLIDGTESKIIFRHKEAPNNPQIDGELQELLGKVSLKAVDNKTTKPKKATPKSKTGTVKKSPTLKPAEAIKKTPAKPKKAKPKV